MIEIHPFGNFVPDNAKYLLIGSFPGKSPGDWYYGTKRNQFWKIIEGVYGITLPSREDKIRLFSKLKLAVTDIIYSCERSHENNLDSNLAKIVYNTEAIMDILDTKKIVKIYFSSRFVETNFNKIYKTLRKSYADIEKITLPCPSPRYARLTLAQKIDIYKKLLPNLKHP